MAPKVDFPSTPVSASSTHLDPSLISGKSSGLAPTGAARTPQDASPSVSRLLYKLIDWLRGKFGEELGPRQLATTLDAVFPESKAWQKTQMPFSTQETDSPTYPFPYRMNDDNGMKLIVTDPCHDQLPEALITNTIQTSAWSAAGCLERLCKEHPGGTVIVQMPICQCAPFAGGSRGHYALMNVSIEKGKIQDARLIDSKGGLIDFFYDGADHLTKQLGRLDNTLFTDPNSFHIDTEYLGDQSIINSSDCGRFAVAHAEHFFSSNPLTYEPIAQDDFFTWCRSVEIDVNLNRESPPPPPASGSAPRPVVDSSDDFLV